MGQQQLTGIEHCGSNGNFTMAGILPLALREVNKKNGKNMKVQNGPAAPHPFG
jgi:hypothetical protein